MFLRRDNRITIDIFDEECLRSKRKTARSLQDESCGDWGDMRLSPGKLNCRSRNEDVFQTCNACENFDWEMLSFRSQKCGVMRNQFLVFLFSNLKKNAILFDEFIFLKQLLQQQIHVTKLLFT